MFKNAEINDVEPHQLSRNKGLTMAQQLRALTYSCRGPELGPQDTHGSSHVLGDPMSSSSIYGHQAHAWYIYMHAGKHTYEINGNGSFLMTHKN